MFVHCDDIYSFTLLMQKFDNSNCKLLNGDNCEKNPICDNPCDMGFNLCVSAIPANAEYYQLLYVNNENNSIF